MIDSLSRFEDDAWTVIWLFPGSELDMRGDRFSIFGEFRSVCKIWTNSYGTIYRDRKNHLRLSSLDYPPSSASKERRNWASDEWRLSRLIGRLFPLFPREIKPKKLDTEPVRSQLRGDFLLGRDQAE
ncbi:hypothetical protein F2Q69_00047535 [Brassica cretica]|uniref:Uncharacterized protein n=1 Tax=Brassica cretica TaxID=69181 RepID=A0A8S9PSP3_BRACR|nr:hypothetical protein F2Q69_00047535 [Brassica cretica]